MKENENENKKEKGLEEWSRLFANSRGFLIPFGGGREQAQASRLRE